MNVMRCLSLAFAILALVTGLVAAFYWYRSSMITYPSELNGITPLGGPTMVFASPLVTALQECGRLNKIAAGCSAAAAFFASVSSFAGSLT